MASPANATPVEYACVWEFHVDPARAAEFERAYGPAGQWVELFRKSEGYIDTLLLRDLRDPSRYVTVDRWSSEAAYRAFRTAYAADYRALDESCSGLTRKETELGEYGRVPAFQTGASWRKR